jgi:hypothetical protein
VSGYCVPTEAARTATGWRSHKHSLRSKRCSVHGRIDPVQPHAAVWQVPSWPPARWPPAWSNG